MKWTRIIAGAILLGCSTLHAGAIVKLDTTKQKEPISKYIYGQFVEHLGNSINRGLWAEMLLDRKFFFPVSDTYEPWGTREDPNWNSGPYKFLKASPWKTIGQPEQVSMDKDHPFTGEHSLSIIIPGSGAETGVSQEGLALVAGKTYVGHVVLAAEGEVTPIVVRLALENGKILTQSIDAVTTEFKEYPVEFTSPSDAENASFDIVSNGNGHISVGAVSLMPADNIRGWRADVVGLLKQLNSPIYRWPGGNFVSGYDWKDGVGPRDKRPPRKNPAWTSVESNDVGIHEFMDLMQLINAEPFIALNMGLGSIESAAAEVDYVLSAADTPMGKLRAQNGHPEPYRATYWAVGNEMFGRWQLGYMPEDQYIKKNNEVANLIWKLDPKAQLVAVGEVGRWDEGMLKGAANFMNLISEHIYSREKPDPVAHAKQLAEQIKARADAHRKYRAEMPELKGKDIRIAMDEWNFWYGPYVFGELGVRYRLKDALGVALGLHEFYRNSDLFFMANYAQTVNVLGAIKTTQTAASLESTGLALKLYRTQFGTIPIEIASQPDGLDVSAAWTADKSAITVSIVNLGNTPNSVTLDLGAGLAFKDASKKWQIGRADLEAYNDPGKPPAIAIKESAATVTGNTLEVAPMSLVIYRLEKR